MNVITDAFYRLTYWAWHAWLRRPFTVPQKVLILQPCCLSQVLLTTPLLAALDTAYPQARFDWAVGKWAEAGVASNPRLTKLINLGVSHPNELGQEGVADFIQRIREQAYDTCIIPTESTLLTYIAWRAGIPQRIGFRAAGRGFAHTFAVPVPTQSQHAATRYLAIAEAIGIATDSCRTEFYASDDERTAVTQWLIESLAWTSQSPLILIHPGGGTNPAYAEPNKQWPIERFVLLCNQLVRQYKAQVVLVGGETDKALTAAINGMMPMPIPDMAGEMSLGWLGALAEVASLYIGNDTGPTHMAAAVGCPTIAIFGPSNPAISSPYHFEKKGVTLWREENHPFSWAKGVQVDEVMNAVNHLLRRDDA